MSQKDRTPVAFSFGVTQTCADIFTYDEWEDRGELIGDYAPSEKFIRSQIKDWLRDDLHLKAYRSREITVDMDKLEFVEFDSGNLSHAGAYWRVELWAPAWIVELANDGGLPEAN